MGCLRLVLRLAARDLRRRWTEAPAVAGAVIGVPCGILLYRSVTQMPLTMPPIGRLLALLVLTVAAVAACTALPARFGARRPIADILAAE